MRRSKTPDTKQFSADDELVNFSIEVLNEHAPLEAGFFLRSLGYNLATTLDAINKAARIVKLKRVIYKESMEEKALEYGFDPFYFEYSNKLEVIEIGNISRISLRNRLNIVIYQIVKEK
jgi:hypothetical protein